MTFIFLICSDGNDLLLSIIHVLCSAVVVGKSNIGTDNDIGEDFEGDSCFCIERLINDLFIKIFSLLLLNTGSDNGGLNTLELIIVVVPHKFDADGVKINFGYDLNDASVKYERIRD